MLRTEPKAAKKAGQPTKYTLELAEKICDLIRDGKSERKIATMENMPSARTIGNWKDEHPEFLRQSARAREESATGFDDDNIEISKWLKTEAEKRMQSGEPFPKGVVEALKVVMQENARQAGLRNDALFGDRKTININDKTEGGGMATYYAKLREMTKETAKTEEK